MKFAIIAAGEGSRLAAEGINCAKPMVEIHGEKLLERLLRIFCENNAEEIVVITRSPLQFRIPEGVKVTVLTKATESSMHSFYELSPYLKDSPFVMTTVDTIFNEKEFSEYIARFSKCISEGCDGLMGVTDYIDDEKPLYIKGTDLIENFLDKDVSHECTYISGGIYGLTPKAIDVLNKCIESGQSRMRNFQRALINDGLQLKLFPFSKVLDIDHASDIDKAERFLRGRITGIYRKEEFSPNCVAKDRNIMDRVLERLSARGYEVNAVSEEEVLQGALPVSEQYLSMARSSEALHLLRGHNVINNPSGTEILSDRRKLFALMREMNIACSDTVTELVEEDFHDGLWVKKAVGTTLTASDTVFCSDRQEYDSAVSDLKARNITEFVTERHVRGDIVKFYGVASTDFFRIKYPSENPDTKFSLERINGAPHHYPFDENLLKRSAERLAEKTGVMVFGGDCVVRQDGSFVIIDFNDWPSFSSFADEAADAISSLVKI